MSRSEKFVDRNKECFWCVYEYYEIPEKRKFNEIVPVVTSYHGTPLCALHAHRIGVYLVNIGDVYPVNRSKEQFEKIIKEKVKNAVVS